MASNEVRIISGLWKGRKLRFPTTAGLRPTLGRVRETLFNWLQGELDGARCLDLYAGSGALGFEALSRGASTVTFVEQNRKVAQALAANAEMLGATAATIVNQDARQFLQRSSEPWDIVFFDPPFGDGNAPAVLQALMSRQSNFRGGLVYVERPSREPLPEEYRTLKQSKAGDCHFALLAT